MIPKSAISLLLTLLFLANSARAQEIVIGLQSNRDISQLLNTQKPLLKSKGITDTLELPLFDDFSNSIIFPDDTLWADNDVYINNTYPVDQLSLGVATFDALDNRGLLYEHASSISFVADHLTSNPINLEGDASDNFYLSFFYQAQGLADPPELSDSLTLQFYSVVDASWNTVWKSEGSELHPFKSVIIAIDDPKFTSKGFRFRFINHATLSSTINDPAMIGNADHWHIDYINLDRGRNPADTLLRDAAFTMPARSVLLNYESMPWNQFKDWELAEMGDSIHLFIVNNDTTERNITRSFTIRDIYEGVEVYSSLTGAKNIASGERVDFAAPVLYTFSSASIDSALFEITSTLITDVFDNKINDTLRYKQLFSNYYSVDDGSAENGYGITANNAMAVYRYHTQTPDSIRAINICFNDSYQNANHRSFDLVVLNASNQSPADIIYTQTEEMLDPGESIDGFVSYRLDEPVYIEDYFFVGWRQRSDTFLNAGLDMNTPSEGRQYYYLNGIWYTSQVGGSLMIRPVVGKPLLITGIDDTFRDTRELDIWPNPVKDLLHINDNGLLPGMEARINIYNTSGNLVWSELYTETINLSHLSEGAYIMVVLKGRHIYSRNKFIRTR